MPIDRFICKAKMSQDEDPNTRGKRGTGQTAGLADRAVSDGLWLSALAGTKRRSARAAKRVQVRDTGSLPVSRGVAIRGGVPLTRRC